MPNSVQSILILSKNFLVYYSMKMTSLETFFFHIFDFKGFGREFPNYEEAQKSQWIHTLLSYLTVNAAESKTAESNFIAWYICLFL